jgi:ubiquinone/menaquinone biosynthesis C-methylase UbiE
LAANIVGESGIVYAVDSDTEAIKRLKTKAEQKHIPNIRAEVGIAEKTVFCNNCADIVFYSMVLHDFKDAVQVLQNAKKMLKPTGLLLDLDWKKMQMPIGPPLKIRFSEQDAAGLMKIAGFKVNQVKDAGPYHYIIAARPSSSC